MTLIGAFILMFLVNIPLALITLAIVPFTGWFTTRYGGKMTRTWRSLFSRVGEFNARIEDNVGEIVITEADEASAVGTFTGPAPAKVGDAVKSVQ